MLASRVEDIAHASDPPELSGKSGELHSGGILEAITSSRPDIPGGLSGLLFGRTLARVTEQRLVPLHDNCNLLVQ